MRVFIVLIFAALIKLSHIPDINWQKLSNTIKEVPKISSFICQARFKDSKFNNKHAGSAFLLNYKQKVYGVTAKHVLFFAKTDKMESVDFGDELLSWEFVSPTDSTIRIQAIKLINKNAQEKLSEKMVGDWLIFEIDQDIPENIVVHQLRDSPLKEGEPLYFEGFPYKNENPTKPIKVKGLFEEKIDDYSFNMKVLKGDYFGCSGGPVTDEQGEVVGLVSMGYYNKKEQRQVFQPASIQYFKEIVSNL